MAATLEKVGHRLVHVIGPDTGPLYHPEAKARINQLVDTLAAQGRDPLPRRVTLVTPTLKYPRQAWLQVDGLQEHWTPGRIDGELRTWPGGPPISRWCCAPAGDRAQPAPADRPRAVFSRPPPPVIIDGQRLAGPAPASDRSYTAAFHKQGGAGKAGRPPDDGRPRKRHDLQGPIDDAFMDSFVFVVPSGKPLSPEVGSWVGAEQAPGHPRVAPSVPRRAARAPGPPADRRGDRRAQPGAVGRPRRATGCSPAWHERLPIRWSKDGIAAGQSALRAPTATR